MVIHVVIVSNLNLNFQVKDIKADLDLIKGSLQKVMNLAGSVLARGNDGSTAAGVTRNSAPAEEQSEMETETDMNNEIPASAQ